MTARIGKLDDLLERARLFLSGDGSRSEIASVILVRELHDALFHLRPSRR